jgi:hypothetical protein
LVDKIVTNNAGIVRSSLDFEYQKQKMLEKDCKVRYKESENLDKLKMEFANQNELPDIEELAEDKNSFKEKTDEYIKLHNEAANKLPYYKMIRKMSMDP